ncbi:MAG: HEAT repeat domain-containing protein [Planctomycetaceae bacterium]|nr:HEAT repeat domain-containing protein [Planctomycetaceae bacterium]
MRLKPDKAGTKIRCPKCRTVVQVPAVANSSQKGTEEKVGSTGFQIQFDELSSQLSKEIDQLSEKKTLSRITLRSLRNTVEKVSSRNYEIDQVREAIDQLGESEDSRAYPILESLWTEEPANLQSSILGAMGQLNDPRGTLFLLRLLKNPLPEIRLAAVQSLAFTEDSRVVPLLVHYGKIHPELKYAVGDSLLKMKGYAIDPVIALLQSSDLEIVADAVILLGRLKTTDAIKPLMEVFQTYPGPIQGHVAEAFGLIGEPKCIPALVPLLKSPDDKIRVQTASALGRVPHPGCLKELIDSLTDPNPEVKKRCAMALGEIGDKRAAPALSKLLQNSQTELKITAAESLGRIGDERAVPYLIEMCHDEDEAVILKALGALRKIKDPGSIEPITQLLHHESSRVRQRAIDVLGQVGDAIVAEQLEQLLRNDRSEDVRAAAAKALGEIGDPGSVDRLIDALHDAFTVKCRAIVALGEIGEESALAPLLAMLKDPAPEVRYHATQALAQMEHELAAKNIQPLLDDSNAMVRRGAAKALETLGHGEAEKILGSSTQQGMRRLMKSVKETLVSVSPGELADSLQHGSPLAKLSLLLVLIGVPMGGYFGYQMLAGGFGSSAPKVVLERRGFATALDLSSDGNQVAAGRSSGLVEIWDVSTKKRIDSYRPLKGIGEVTGISLIPGKNQIFVGSLSTAGGYDLDSEKMLWEISGHSGPLTHFQPSNDRSKMMVASQDGVVSFWDVTTGKAIGSGALQLPASKMTKLELSNNGEFLIGVGGNPAVTVWSTEDGSELNSYGSFEARYTLDIQISPDDTQLAVSNSVGKLMILDVESGKTLFELSEPAKTESGRTIKFENLSFADSGSKLRANFGRILVNLDLESKEITTTPLTMSPHSLQFQPGGNLFVAAELEGSPVYVCEQGTGEQKAKLEIYD